MNTRVREQELAKRIRAEAFIEAYLYDNFTQFDLMGSLSGPRANTLTPAAEVTALYFNGRITLQHVPSVSKTMSLEEYVDKLPYQQLMAISQELGLPYEASQRRVLADDPIYRWRLMFKYVTDGDVLLSITDELVKTLGIDIPSGRDPSSYVYNNLPGYRNRLVKPLGPSSLRSLVQTNDKRLTLSYSSDFDIYFMLGVQQIAHVSRADLLDRAVAYLSGVNVIFVADGQIYLGSKDGIRLHFDGADLYEMGVLNYTEGIVDPDYQYILLLNLSLIPEYRADLPGGKRYKKMEAGYIKAKYSG